MPKISSEFSKSACILRFWWHKIFQYTSGLKTTTVPSPLRAVGNYTAYCVCVCLEFAAFISRLYTKINMTIIPFYFSPVFRSLESLNDSLYYKWSSAFYMKRPSVLSQQKSFCNRVYGCNIGRCQLIGRIYIIHYININISKTVHFQDL